MRVEWDVGIEMDDHVVLRADVFLPDEDGRFPVIVSCGPYGKGVSFAEGFPGRWAQLVREFPEVVEGTSAVYANFEMPDPEKWVPDGYVCVRIDSRGTGRSEGHLCLLQERETLDYYACVEWAAQQAWSNGKVGLSGISYLAMNQWLVAARQPPHLAAMIPWEGAADYYRDATHHGGIRTTFWDLISEGVVGRVQHGVGERGLVNPNNNEPVAGPETLTDETLRAHRCDFRAELKAHELDDKWYQVRSPDWTKVTVPFLSCGNWGGHGLHLRGNTEAFLNAPARQKWLEIHGLEHWSHYYSNYGTALQKEFFECFLKGVDNGWEARPPVLLQIRTVDGFIERAEDDWPLARTQWTRLYLDPHELGLAWRPPPDAGSVSYEPLDDTGVTFSSAPFSEETEITGPVAARLYIESTSADADLFLVLRVLDPNGEEITFRGAQGPGMPIAQGWLRASHRKLDLERTRSYRPYHSHDEVQPLAPGTVYQLDIELWSTSLVIPSGYQLVLTVRGTDFFADPMKPEQFGPGHIMHDDPDDQPRSTFGGTVRLHAGGDHDAYLLVPVIPR